MTNVRDRTIADLVENRLLELGLETPLDVPLPDFSKQSQIKEHIRQIMIALGLDLRDDSLKETPGRVAKMYCEEVFYGLDYANFPACSTFENKMKVDEMVSGSCSINSFCEHHLVPFIGVAHIAYIPSTKILGLSKFNRVADFFARRPQVQERLTSQIFEALCVILDIENVAVVIKATHYCVHLRGVKDLNSVTTTSKMGGKFMTVPALRNEFLSLTRT